MQTTRPLQVFFYIFGDYFSHKKTLEKMSMNSGSLKIK